MRRGSCLDGNSSWLSVGRCDGGRGLGEGGLRMCRVRLFIFSHSFFSFCFFKSLCFEEMAFEGKIWAGMRWVF